MKIVVMGVSGSGKSTLAAALAKALHSTYLDAMIFTRKTTLIGWRPAAR